MKYDDEPQTKLRFAHPPCCTILSPNGKKRRPRQQGAAFIIHTDVISIERGHISSRVSAYQLRFRGAIPGILMPTPPLPVAPTPNPTPNPYQSLTL